MTFSERQSAIDLIGTGLAIPGDVSLPRSRPFVPQATRDGMADRIGGVTADGGSLNDRFEGHHSGARWAEWVQGAMGQQAA